MDFRAPLARVRGLGAAGEGVHHWWMQRVTAIALVPLMLWLLGSVITVVGKPYADASAWLQGPVNAALMILLVACLFYHAYLGLRVVIEDYVHDVTTKLISLLGLKFLLSLLAVIAILAVIRVYLGD